MCMSVYVLNVLCKYSCIFSYCAIPENIHTSPTEGIFSKTPTPLEIPIKLHIFL